MSAVRYLLRLSLLLLLVFAMSRVVFLVGAVPTLHAESFGTVLSSFYHGLKTDVATVCYLLFLPALLVAIESLIRSRFLYHIRRWYVRLILLVNAIITSAEPGLYHEWGTKLNYKALLYLEHPSEIFHTATASLLVLFVVMILLQWVVGLFLYNRIVRPVDEIIKQSRSALIIVPLYPILIIGLRGGVQEIPMSAGDSYYSTNPTLNWSTVNSLWNLGQSILTGMQYGRSNPYHFMPDKEAAENVAALYQSKCDLSEQILTTTKPNIVLVIFEGWSADLSYSISGIKEHSCTPHFDELAASGLLFKRCFASGERSDQGLTAVLSGFPALPLSSIVNYTAKVDQLPSLLEPFQKDGYSSLFLFGGQLSYGNLRTLIYHNKFDKVIEEKDIDPSIYRGRLGVHDQHTFDILQRALDTMHQPFFSGFFTQSTHFSYDYPGAKQGAAIAGDASGYTSSLLYADSCLGDFMKKAKKKPWFKNTLFILVADHSHVVPWNDDHHSSAMHHIPLLLYGDVIADDYRGKAITATVSQQDIAATLLSQTRHDHGAYDWSRDVFSSCSNHFAYWTFTEGFGLTTDSCEVVYDLAGRKMIKSQYAGCDSAIFEKQAFSYMQMVMEDFLRK